MKHKITITIDDYLVKEIDGLAPSKNLNRSEFINYVLVDWFKTKDYISNSLPEILNGITDIKKYFDEICLNEFLNASSGSGTGGPERSDALPEKSETDKKSTLK